MGIFSWLLGGAVILVGVVVYCCLKAASDADDRMEEISGE